MEKNLKNDPEDECNTTKQNGINGKIGILPFSNSKISTRETCRQKVGQTKFLNLIQICLTVN